MQASLLATTALTAEVGALRQGLWQTAPESSTIPDCGGRPPSKRSKPTEPASSVQPEAPDNLLEELEGASIDEEHRAIMSTVVQKVRYAKSGLNEACASLLTDFKVSKNM